MSLSGYLQIFYFTALILVAGSCTTYQTFDRDKSIILKINDSSQVVMGSEKWENQDDCSALVYINTLTNGFLITVEVTDDSVRTGNEASYQNDGLELYFDLRPIRLRKRNIYEKGVFQAVIIPQPGKRNVAPISWYPTHYKSEVTGATAFTQLFSKGYIVQVFLPFSSLRLNHFWPRQNFSFDIGINDADVLNRETQMMWKGKFDNYISPSNFEPIFLDSNKSSRPNFLLILTDHQTMSASGAYGNPYLRTPNIDALAEWGIRFTRSYCASPSVFPSKAAIITGLLPHKPGLSFSETGPDSVVVNIGQLFHENGYQTIWAGKWFQPQEFPGCNKVEKVRGFDVLKFLSPEKVTGRGEDMDTPLTDAIVKALKRRMDKPFLLVVSYLNPGDIRELPLRPDAYPSALNPVSTPPLPQNSRIPPDEPQFLSDRRQDQVNQRELYNTGEFTSMQWRNYLFHYYQMTERIDREIGRLINVLEYKGLDENTIIILTSLQGEAAGAHQWAGGNAAWEEAVKVPLILSMPGKNLRNTIDDSHLVSGIDIFPTLLDFAGINIPGDIDGMSLKAITENPDTSWRNHLVSEIPGPSDDPGNTAKMIRWKNYKYVLYPYGRNVEQLFDLAKDPGEMTNLVSSPQYYSVRSEMRQMLKEWMKSK